MIGARPGAWISKRYGAVADQIELVGRTRLRETGIPRRRRACCGRNPKSPERTPRRDRQKTGVQERSAQALSSRLLRCGPRSGPDRCRLFGDVDPDRTPGDATSAADATRAAELVEPARQLVSDPLAVARLASNCRTLPPWMYEKSSVKQESQRRTRSATVLGEVGCVVDGRAKARRADHRAIGAGKTAFCDLIPARMVGVGLQQFFKAVGVEVAPHRLPGLCDDGVGGFDLGFGCRPVRHACGEVRPGRLPTSITNK